MADRVGIVLADLGGPATEGEVRPFVERLLADPAILPFPGWIRRRAAWLIAWLRESHAVAKYRAIGGGSPLPGIVEQQAFELQRLLGSGLLVRYGFPFSAPFLGSTFRSLKDEGAKGVVVVPTFPQHSVTTVGPTLRAAEEAARQLGLWWTHTPSFPEGSGFLEAVAELAQSAVEGADWVVFAAHGLPESLARQGDAYPHEVGRTAAVLGSRLGSASRGWSLAFHSRLGPARWLQPALHDEIRRLAGRGVKVLTVVPVSFACENLETLYDLDLEAAAEARRAGITVYRRVAAPGVHPSFIQQLATLVRSALGAFQEQKEEPRVGREGQP